ncbi:hypothetical protein ACPUYX_11325 [Desulfosporosinus sp. SYSU MS00001]|uniref:hypothetical protein n=1 Tax=Desulfosporosinus sp. SYSU MS00001 TaxID=3416284 RepID=UPI003CF8A152
MTLSFWQQVSTSWQSVQQDAIQSAVDLTHFTNLLLLDLRSVRDDEDETEIELEINNDDDFWGGL